jgi:hypothetical protein
MQDADPDQSDKQDPDQSDKQDPDPDQNDKQDPDPDLHQRDADPQQRLLHSFYIGYT